MSNRAAISISGFASRIASLLGPRAMRRVAQINKRVTNPLQALLAPHLDHMAIIEHRGRKTGKAYRTPVMVFVEGNTLSVALNYGQRSDWVRNVLTEGSAIVSHRGSRYVLTAPGIVADSPPSSQMTRVPANGILRGTLVAA